MTTFRLAQPADEFTQELRRDSDGSVYTLEFGRCDWNDPENNAEGDLAVRLRRDINGRYDPHSSSIIPLGWLPDVQAFAVECLASRWTPTDEAVVT